MADLPRRIQDLGLFSTGQSILVAVSGGLDSMVLLYCLHGLASANGWRLAVGHLNHRLRGRSSAADARLVRITAQALKLKVVVGSADVKTLARTENLSLEMAARKARHEFLARAARRLRIKTIALAHHADDQVELFCLRLLRGGGAEGLSGMKWKTRSPVDASLELARPLLGCTRNELRQWAQQQGIKFREDASNACLDFQRNRIRHKLLPLLKKEYQPRIESVLLRAAEILAAEADFVGHAAEQWLKAAATPASRVRPRSQPQFEHLHAAVQRRVIIIQLRGLGALADFQGVERLRERPNCALMLRPLKSPPHREIPSPRSGLRVRGAAPLLIRRRPDGLLEHVSPKTAGFVPGSRCFPLEGQGEAAFGGLRVCWELTTPPPLPIPKQHANSELFDADRIGLFVVLRYWAPGDRFHPIGMASAVKLQDMFTNLKVPKSQRHRRLIAVAADGEIFWVEDLRISDRFKLTSRTTRALHWSWERL